MLNYALEYYLKGYSIIPIKPDKHPYIKEWLPYQKTTPDKEQITKWWTRWPSANIAVVCGKLSGVMVIDIDTQEAKESIDEFLPDSLDIPTTRTPNNGWHLYFRFKEGLSNKSGALPGVDIRTQGGYIISAPSSCHYEKNGNIIDGKHLWINNFKLGYSRDFPEMPSMLFDTLLFACNNNRYSNTSCIGENDDSQEAGSHQESSMSSIVINFLKGGSRDDSLFHTANCLVKGGCEKPVVKKILEILAKNCDPPFSEKEAEIKIESALQRKERREGNLTADIRDFILSSSGIISSSFVIMCHQLSSRSEKQLASNILNRLCKEGLVEKTGARAGEFRVIDNSCKPIDWTNADENYIPVWIPLGLDQIAGVLPGNILVFAGAKDSGKTAWLLNIAKENRHKYKVHYFNSEMGAAEFKMRASKFDDIHPSQWNNVSVYERNNNFHDVIRPGEGNLNIIDYLEAPDEVWKVGSWIQKIHAKLDGAICMIGLQKKIGVELGRGAEFSMEKARLYISLDYGRAKIISCKNFLKDSPIGNPRGYQCFFKLVGGVKLIKDRHLGWHKPLEKEK
uniref:Putative bifunctional DNA primase/polymerase n=1 Tax=viral metagenome TaxID=1070528 RepID=A0A6M3L2B7_9ZZZZ